MNKAFLLLLLSLVGCASLSKQDFKPVGSDTKASPLIGRILVNLDNDEFTENCMVFLKFGNDNPTSYQLDSTGEVRLMIKPGTSAALTKIECRGFNTYTYVFWPAFPATVNGTEGELTYFGTIKMVWNTKWNLNPASLVAGLVTPGLAHDFLYKSGPISLEIQNESEEEFRRMTSQYSDVKLKPRIAIAKVIQLSPSSNP